MKAIRLQERHLISRYKLVYVILVPTIKLKVFGTKLVIFRFGANFNAATFWHQI